MNLRDIQTNNIAEYKSPFDFSAAYTSSTTITLSGGHPTISQSTQVKEILQIKSDNTSFIYRQGVNGVTFTVSSGVITISGAGTPFASGDVYEVSIEGQRKGYDSSTQSMLSSQLNPEYSHYTDIEDVSEENLAADTYYQEIEMASYKNLFLHLKGSGGVTFTLEATGFEDGTWVDVSTDLLGVASLADSEDVYFITDKMPLKFRVKYVTSDATNAVDIKIRRY